MKKIFTNQKDLTLSVVKEMVKNKDLNLQPDYQREYIYNKRQASSLIESILMDIPIPTIYLSEEKDNSYSVIDGQQRLTSFTKFLNNDFNLLGLEKYSELNGLKFKDLDAEIKRKLNNSTLHCIALNKECEDFKYELFSRLNQVSAKLTPQEIRNCVFKGNLNNHLFRISENEKLKKILKKKNSRMAYQELILRMMLSLDGYTFTTNFLKTINRYMFDNKDISDVEIYEKERKVFEILDLVYLVLGEKAFVSYNFKKNKFTQNFNAPIMDSIIIAFSMFDKESIIKNKNKIKSAIENVKINNREYIKVTSEGTGSKPVYLDRIRIIYETIAPIVGNMGNNKSVTYYFLSEIKNDVLKNCKMCDICKEQFLNIDDITFELDEGRFLTRHEHCNYI